ncbi:DUF6894 family protein [Rhizobium sp. Leaf341]|uniref:DUF6894 family protein n=1 Tax=Rhizobium sp. Leaf341 TaxID=1736344 RepID=UPI0007162B2A|nr:hypothetical protein [Rhizobium sp. Leaf341]KQR77558.1 hypothetical protein ASG03_14205 [Rhizobium sp. Leaf341]
MTHYYFNIRRHDVLDRDLEGAEFATFEEAYEEASQAAREMLAEKVLANHVIDGSCFEITTEDGAVAGELAFRSLIRFT